MAPEEISFGILLYPIQALDAVGPMDVLCEITHAYISQFQSAEEAERLQAPDVKFHWIGPTLEPILTTGGLRLSPTTTFADCPRLDTLLIGGSTPQYASDPPADLKDFVLTKTKEVSTIFTTCTGGLTLASTGLLDDVEATVNHMFINSHATNLSPSTKWDKEKNWVVSNRTLDDGHALQFWTASGAVAGMDMMSQWIRTRFEHGQELLDLSTMALEYQPRDVHAKAMRFRDGNGQFVEV